MKIRGLVSTLALAAILAIPAHADLMRIYYPDVEQGSATLVVSPTGKALLVDAGSGIRSSDDDVVELIRDLINQGIVTDFAYTVASHYDEDHIGRMDDVLNFGIVSSTAIAYDRGTAGGTPGTFAYDDYAAAAANHDRTTITPTTTIDLGGGVTVRCYVLNAELPDSSSVSLTGTEQQENARSVGVVVSYGDVDVWIGGDLTGNTSLNFADVEGAVAPFVGDVDVYTFNHHGSNSSSTQDFLDVLQAEVGIAQVATDNTFGHPRAEVVQRFLDTPDTNSNDPLVFQQNPANPEDERADNTKADYIHDSDDLSAEQPFGLPATITLLSDGTSYQIFGGVVAPVKLAADAGLGTLGNYPPAVIETWRSPLVPTSAQSVTVSAEIHDEASFTAQIVYSVDGVAQTPVSMSQVGSTDVWEGTIPAQSDGDKVVYRVEATGNSQTASSFSWGYFSGTTPIATLRQNDGDGLLVPMRYHARVQGKLTVAPGVFHPIVSQVWVQDSAGDGIQIFDGSLLALALGDEAVFVGSLEQFAGQTQLNIVQDWGNFGATFVTASTAPSPVVRTVGSIGEAYEGELVRLNGVSIITDGGIIYGSGDSNLTVTDNGGTSTVIVRIDEDTDIPGANTPTQAFDVIGIVSQYDSAHPFTAGYQILPRGKADFITEEVNHPDVILSEIHADPHASSGDANGDSTVSTTHDEFVEIWNTTYAEADVSDWEIHDATGLRFTFPSNTVIPAREAAVVFGGGTPTGDFGNAMANGLVFSASLGLNNTGDTVTLKDDLGATVQSVTYGSEGGDDQSLTRSPDYTNAPFVKHTVADTVDASRFSPGTTIFGAALTVPAGAVLLTEVMYDPTGADGGLEWVEICNTTDQAIDLSKLSLGWGGDDYTEGSITLEGTLPANGVWVIGGPTSSSANANPTLDDAVELLPNLQNSGTTADGVALFNYTASHVKATSVPVNAVIYGTTNTNNLLDETGSAGSVDVGDAPSGQSIARTSLGGAWSIQSSPGPNSASVCAGGGGGGGEPELILTEVFYDASGSDNGLEWVEIKNVGDASANLSGYSLGWGGSNYTTGKLQLSGTLAAGAVMVVGGTTSSSTNYNPTLTQSSDFNPDIQNGDNPGDGLALFDVAASSVTSSTVPIDAVVWGSNNDNNLIDETGSANSPEVGPSAEGTSIERTTLGGAWQVQSTPTPNSCSL